MSGWNGFQVATLVVQLIGLAVIIFGGGKYLGRTEVMFQQLFNADKALKEELAEHKEENREDFKDVWKGITSTSKKSQS